MKFWDRRKELEFIVEDKIINSTNVKHGLYEENFITGMKSIFNITLENKGIQENANILTFIGTRGSGKTTAMKDFCEILKGMEEEKNKEIWVSKAIDEKWEREKLLMETFYFRVLDPIDASLAEDREELFELILAKLYKAYSGEVNRISSIDGQGIRKREIIKKFEKLLQMYQISKSGENKETITFSTLLQNIGGSGEIAENLSLLIEQLLELEGKQRTHEYVVITIDDLDLNIKNGYRMLEQLQKYFAYYKIIILVAVDYDQMVLVCTKHFMNEMGLVNVYSDESSGDYSLELHCRKLANDYMMKVFPLEHRMYMPDMRKLTKKAIVLLDRDVKEKGEREKKEGCLIKYFLMYKIAEAMHIYYDICGMKYHFCEPDTVRTLVEYNGFLNDLDRKFCVDSGQLVCYQKFKYGNAAVKERIKENNLEILRSYDRNHERFNWDIMKRLAQTTLNQYQNEFFKNLLERDLERRAMYFVQSDRYREQIRMRDINFEQYSYGELLQKLYEWGRKYYDDKPLVSCIIASFTTEMVREYIFYRYLGDDDKGFRSLDRLKGFLGKDFSNKWLREMFPKVFYISENKKIKTDEIGYISEIEQSAFRIEYHIEELKELKELNEEKLILKYSKTIENIVGKWLKKMQMVPVLECIDMFLNYKGEEKGGFKFALGVSQIEAAKSNEKDDKVCVIMLKDKEYSLDMMGFVKKSLQFEEIKKRLHIDIVNGITNVIREQIVITEDSIKILKSAIWNAVKKQSLLEKYKSDGDVAFPFYNLDLSYNVIKRVRRKKKMEYVSESQILEAISKVYFSIERELKEQDRLYAPVTNQIKYGDLFANNPYIRMIYQIHKNSMHNEEERYIKEQLQSVICSIIYNTNTSDNKQPDLPEN